MPSPRQQPSANRLTENAPILITMGEPGGIGPEVAVDAFHALQGECNGRPLKLVGDPSVFGSYGGVVPASALIETHPLAVPLVPGTASPENTRAVVDAIDEAVALVRNGVGAAVVTGPIHKSSLMQGGFEHAGHTQYLAEITGAPRAVMMLTGAGLRVIPYTVHIPLSQVSASINTAGLVETGQIILSALRRDFGIAAPRLALAGLNPHAGEEGALGDEEREHILPAIEALKGTGAEVIGPLPADTMFHKDARDRYDAALCMYHDQALIPLKTLAFWEGVNVTLGLPIVRTSPDHGTALDIAGKGEADSRSMIAAIRLAAHIADARD